MGCKRLRGFDSLQPDKIEQVMHKVSHSQKLYNYRVKDTSILCAYCNKKFKRSRRRINEAIKFGWNSYCSLGCQFSTRLNGEHKTCQNCGKKVWRTPKDLKSSLTGKFFCNRSCAAIFNNHVRSEARPKNFCKHPDCQKQIPRSQIYCSRICAAYSRKRTIESLRKEVLSKIRKFHKLNKRIPVKKEMYTTYGKARDAFSTWNKAIEAAGFKPNPVMFAKKYISRDGHKCDSLAEKIIDEWFYYKNISHKRSVPYPEFKKMTCDFVTNNFFIEFFGLEGQHKEYTKIVYKKRRLSKKYKIKLIEIKPSDLFPKNKLDQVLNFLT